MGEEGKESKGDQLDTQILGKHSRVLGSPFRVTFLLPNCPAYLSAANL
jgi:hypothetical protein